MKHKILATATRRAETIAVPAILTDRDALESVLSPEQVEIVETMAADMADHSLASDTFAAQMVAHVKALWPKGCDWDTWKAVRGVIYSAFGEYGALCLRKAYDAAGIGARPTASGNASGNKRKGTVSGAKWISGIDKLAADFLARVAKIPKRDIDPRHIARFIELAKSLRLEVKAARKDMAA